MPKRKKPSNQGRRGGGGRTPDAVSYARGDHEKIHDDDDEDEDDSSHVPRTSKGDEISHIPLRDTDSLFVAPETVACVKRDHCVPCAYKIGLFDVALDKDFCHQVPNQRPEQCPRLVALTNENKDNDNDTSTDTPPSSALVVRNSMGYQPGMSVLTVGDGDFSFSLAVARILFAQSTNNVTSDNRSSLVATSYESEDTLRRVYPNFDETLEELHRLGATTLYQVDATRLDQTLPQNAVPLPPLFHRICWNFPCTAISKGQDGQNQEMEENKQLVRGFVASAMPFLAKDCGGGEIHICHKTKPPFNQWKLEEAVLEGCAESNSPLAYSGRVVLDRALLPPYIPRKALDRKSFPCHDACVFIFQGSKTSAGTSINTPTSSWFEPTIPLQADGKDTRAEQGDQSSHPFPVTPALILALRTHCLRMQFKRNSKKQKSSRYSSNYGKNKRQKR